MAGYTEFKTDGTMRSHGDATTWNDMLGDLFGVCLVVVLGTTLSPLVVIVTRLRKLLKTLELKGLSGWNQKKKNL